jgi:hypothetical protein
MIYQTQYLERDDTNHNRKKSVKNGNENSLFTDASKAITASTATKSF